YPQRPVSGVAMQPIFAVAHLPPSLTLFNQLKWGQVFRVYGQGVSFAFNLTGTAAALSKLADCVHARVGGTNPYAPPPPPPPAPPSVSSAPPSNRGATPQRERVMTLVANLFVQAGLSNMQMLSVEETPAALKNYDLVWKGPNLVGAAKYFAPSRD